MGNILCPSMKGEASPGPIRISFTARAASCSCEPLSSIMSMTAASLEARTGLVVARTIMARIRTTISPAKNQPMLLLVDEKNKCRSRQAFTWQCALILRDRRRLSARPSACAPGGAVQAG